jgi:hypothetical protein
MSAVAQAYANRLQKGCTELLMVCRVMHLD